MRHIPRLHRSVPDASTLHCTTQFLGAPVSAPSDQPANFIEKEYRIYTAMDRNKVARRRQSVRPARNPSVTTETQALVVVEEKDSVVERKEDEDTLMADWSTEQCLACLACVNVPEEALQRLRRMKINSVFLFSCTSELLESLGATLDANSLTAIHSCIASVDLRSVTFGEVHRMLKEQIALAALASQLAAQVQEPEQAIDELVVALDDTHIDLPTVCNEPESVEPQECLTVEPKQPGDSVNAGKDTCERACPAMQEPPATPRFNSVRNVRLFASLCAAEARNMDAYVACNLVDVGTAGITVLVARSTVVSPNSSVASLMSGFYYDLLFESDVQVQQQQQQIQSDDAFDRLDDNYAEEEYAEDDGIAPEESYEEDFPHAGLTGFSKRKYLEGRVADLRLALQKEMSVRRALVSTATDKLLERTDAIAAEERRASGVDADSSRRSAVATRALRSLRVSLCSSGCRFLSPYMAVEGDVPTGEGCLFPRHEGSRCAEDGRRPLVRLDSLHASAADASHLARERHVRREDVWHAARRRRRGWDCSD